MTALNPGSPRGGDIGECWPNVLAPDWKDLNFVRAEPWGCGIRITIYSLITGLIAF